MAPIFTIIGATGIQGGSVFEAALESGLYKIRAITRNPYSEAGKALTARGVEVVAADLNDEASLVKAFQGSTAIFALTNFYETFATGGPQVALAAEITQGTNLARAASKTASLKHYIWSTLPDGEGAHVVPHFKSKIAVDAVIKEDKNLFAKTTFLLVGFYTSNYLYPFFTPNYIKTAGKYAQMIPFPPTSPIVSIGSVSANLGRFTNAILAQPALTHTKYVLAVKNVTSLGRMLEEWSEVTGKPSVYVQVSVEDFNVLWPGFGMEMGVMFKFLESEGPGGTEKKSGMVGWEELRIKEGELVGHKEALKEIDWSALL